MPPCQNNTTNFIEALGLGSTNLMGWSDGAITALLVSISRPDLVRRLVCVGGSFNTSSVPAPDQDWIRSATPESFRKNQPKMVKRYDQATPDGPAHFQIVFEKTKKLWLTEPDIQREELAKITAPTLVMVGDRDAVVPEHTLECSDRSKGHSYASSLGQRISCCTKSQALRTERSWSSCSRTWKKRNKLDQ